MNANRKIAIIAGILFIIATAASIAGLPFCSQIIKSAHKVSL